MKKKTPQPGATRKPPTPSDDHAEIEAWMRRSVMPGLHPIVEALDTLIRRTVPSLEYSIKWRRAFYGLAELGWIIEVVPYDVSVNVVFHGGADFQSPPPLGDTDRTRYVKIKTVEEADGPEIRGWIDQARRVPGWR